MRHSGDWVQVAATHPGTHPVEMMTAQLPGTMIDVLVAEDGGVAPWGTFGMRCGSEGDRATRGWRRPLRGWKSPSTRFERCYVAACPTRPHCSGSWSGPGCSAWSWSRSGGFLKRTVADNERRTGELLCTGRGLEVAGEVFEGGLGLGLLLAVQVDALSAQDRQVVKPDSLRGVGGVEGPLLLGVQLADGQVAGRDLVHLGAGRGTLDGGRADIAAGHGVDLHHHVLGLADTRRELPGDDRAQLHHRVVAPALDPTGPHDHPVLVEGQLGVSKKNTWRIWASRGSMPNAVTVERRSESGTVSFSSTLSASLASASSSSSWASDSRVRLVVAGIVKSPPGICGGQAAGPSTSRSRAMTRSTWPCCTRVPSPWRMTSGSCRRAAPGSRPGSATRAPPR